MERPGLGGLGTMAAALVMTGSRRTLARRLRRTFVAVWAKSLFKTHHPNL
jgi:hypothetical protein